MKFRQISAWAVLISALLVVLAALFTWQRHYSERHVAQREHLAEFASDGRRICKTDQGLGRLLQCVIVQRMPFYDRVSAPDYGLETQQDMAETAYLAFWVSCASLLVGAVSIAFILGTFRVTQNELRLSHPPKLRVTRPHLFGERDRGLVPARFSPGAEVFGQAFVENYGRFAATIQPKYPDRSVLHTDCYLLFAKSAPPSVEAYLRQSDPAKWARIEFYGENGRISPGNFASWAFSTKVPDDFKVDRKGKWSHNLFLIGHVRYYGAAGDARGYFFCKKYDPKNFWFESVPQLEYDS